MKIVSPSVDYDIETGQMRRRYCQQLQQFHLRFSQGMKICAHAFAKVFLDLYVLLSNPQLALLVLF